MIDLTGSREEAAQEARVSKAAHIQTSDGFFVDVDVSILYNIVDPYLVFTRLGTGRLFEINGIIPKAEPVLKQALGELTTEEFYNSPLRSAKAQLASDLLNRDLAEYGMKVDQVLIRYFRYTDEIQKNIEEKKLKDQLVLQEPGLGPRRHRRGKAVEGDSGRRGHRQHQAAGGARLHHHQGRRARPLRPPQTRRADLLVKLAEARKTQLRNEALQGAGADRMVGLKMAEVYKGIEVLVLPSDGPHAVNPLDIEQTMKLLQVAK